MAETRQEFRQRISQRDLERQAREGALKRGLGSFGPQAAWLAGLMAPSSGVTDYFGLYPESPTGEGITGEKLPSFAENIQNKQHLDALYQGLGIAGDAMYASTPVTGPLGILGGMALKGVGAVGKATKASKSLKSKKYGDYFYHITPTKNVESIKKRGLNPTETSNYLKGEGGSRYQEDPRIFAWTNPVDAMHFLNRMHGPFGTDNMDEFSMIRIRKTNGGKWEKDLALDPHMAYSNVDEIQKATGEKGLVSVQTGAYKGIDSADIIDHIEVKDLQKELGDFIPSDLVYPGQGSYTGVEYSDAVTDLMNKGGISKATASKVDVSYRGSHQISSDFGAPMHNMTKDIYPDDLYSSQGLRLYGDSGGIDDKASRESYNIIQKVRNIPNAEVTVYRAVPKGAKTINDGDFVTPSKEYAQRHNDLVHKGKGDILSKKVKAKDLYTEGNSINEFGYYPEAQKPIKAYHGSPHDFEKFDIGKIGSGEGFQAFGRGIYFAEAEDVAKVYRNALSRRQVFYDGKPVKFKLGSVRELENPTGDSEIDTALMMMQENRETPEEFIKYMEDEAIEIPSMKDFYQQWAEKIRKVKDKITLKSRGKVYETDIHVTPDELLDWDEPLSKQPKAVQKKLDSLPKMSDEYDVGKMNYRYHFFTKEDDLLDTELPSFKTEEEAMHFLNDPDADDYYNWLTAGQYRPIEKARIGELDKAGIKGIKYSDALSRGTEGGTSNYVIFDDRVIDISKKYGVAIPVAGAMLLSIDKGEKAIEGGRKDI